MHTLRYITYLLSLLVAITSCSDDFLKSGGDLLQPTLTPKYLNVEKNSFNIPSEGEQGSIKILSVGVDWNIENSIDWIDVYVDHGTGPTEVTVVARSNPSAERRVGVFYLNSTTEGYPMRIPITMTQDAASPILTVSEERVSFQGTSSEKQISVTSNTDWEASCAASWITCQKTDNALTIRTTANTTETTRSAVVNIQYHKGLKNRSIYVKQSSALIFASTQSLSFGQAASAVDIKVQSEADWTASSSSSWIEVSPTTGNAGTSTLTISVAPNMSQEEREGNVILTIGGHQRISIPIKQAGVYLNVAPTNVDIAASGNSKYEIGVTSNVNWVVQSESSWIEPNVSEGKGDQTLQLNIADNPSIHERDGQVQISCPGTTLKGTIHVHQEGKSFSVNEAKLNFSDLASTQEIEITSDGTWQAEISNDWIHLSPTNATGNATLSISVDENYDAERRYGNVHLSMAEKSIDLPVEQGSKYLSISNDLKEISSHSSKIDVSITSNFSWKASAEEGADKWIDVSPSEGCGNMQMTVGVADNASMNARSGTVAVKSTAPTQLGCILSVKQAARYLNVNTEQLTFYSKGGTSEPIYYHTDGEVSVSTDKDWLSVTTSPTDSCFTLSAQVNPSNEIRKGNVIVKLSDLKVGTYELRIPVVQQFQGGSFMRTDFNSDHDYNNDSSSGVGFTIRGYGHDQSYSNGSQPNLQLNIIGYGSDSNYGSGTNLSNLTLTLTRYQTDQNWNAQFSSHLTIVRTGYGADGDWNKTGNVSGTLGHSRYGNDSEWNKNGNKDATINKSHFSSDNNWNE